MEVMKWIASDAGGEVKIHLGGAGKLTGTVSRLRWTDERTVTLLRQVFDEMPGERLVEVAVTTAGLEARFEGWPNPQVARDEHGGDLELVRSMVPEGLEIHHRDGDPENNDLDNLELRASCLAENPEGV